MTEAKPDGDAKDAPEITDLSPDAYKANADGAFLMLVLLAPFCSGALALAREPAPAEPPAN